MIFVGEKHIDNQKPTDIISIHSPSKELLQMFPWYVYLAGCAAEMLQQIILRIVWCIKKGTFETLPTRDKYLAP